MDREHAKIEREELLALCPPRLRARKERLLKAIDALAIRKQKHFIKYSLSDETVEMSIKDIMEAILIGYSKHR